MARTFELAAWHEVSPNERGEYAGMCMITGEHGPGVVLKGYEPADADYLFVSEQVIFEAFASVVNSTPTEVHKRFKNYYADAKYYKQLERQNDELQKELDEIKFVLEGLRK